jgi:hypothetical protein
VSKARTTSKKTKVADRPRAGAGGRRRRRGATRPTSRPAVAPAVAPTPVPAPAGLEPPAVVSEPIAVTVPEAAFAGRVPTPGPPRPLPLLRRGIFFDVENSSRPDHVTVVLDHLEIDWMARATDLVAIGNWRVVSHETARLLASRGAQLVHSAPSVGIRDWTDLRIAVAAGAWLAAARPGDSVEIISDDQAFDAVGDVAATLGVRFHRLSFRALAGLNQVEPGPAPVALVHNRQHRGRRRRGPAPSARGHAAASGSPAPPRHAVPTRPRSDAPAVAADEAHTAPADEIKHVVEELLATAPGEVTLDAVGNALKARGFRRTPGSPRLITRLRRLKGLEVTPRGIVRLIESARHERPPDVEERSDVGKGELWVEVVAGARDAEDETGGSPEGPGTAAEPEDAALDEDGAAPASVESAPRTTASWRRRRRRGGRRWRGRGAAGRSPGTSVAVVEQPRDAS